MTLLAPVGQTAHAQSNTPKDFVPPAVFQAAGTKADSIQGTVAQFRTAVGDPNNGIGTAPDPHKGRREINWDGGGTATTITGTPLTNFQAARGALFTTPGAGFVQAPLSGLVTTFGNPTYETIFRTFSDFRLFSAIGSNVTEVVFFVPGAGNMGAESFIEKNPQTVEKFIKALIEASTIMRAQKERGLAVLQKHIKTDRALAEIGYKNLLEDLTAYTLTSVKGLRTVQEIVALRDPKIAKYNVEDLLDQRILKKLVDSGYVEEIERRYKIRS